MCSPSCSIHFVPEELQELLQIPEELQQDGLWEGNCYEGVGFWCWFRFFFFFLFFFWFWYGFWFWNGYRYGYWFGLFFWFRFRFWYQHWYGYWFWFWFWFHFWWLLLHRGGRGWLRGLRFGGDQSQFALDPGVEVLGGGEHPGALVTRTAPAPARQPHQPEEIINGVLAHQGSPDVPLRQERGVGVRVTATPRGHWEC